MKRPELAISRSNIPALGACLDYVPRMPNEIMPWDEATDYPATINLVVYLFIRMIRLTIYLPCPKSRKS